MRLFTVVVATALAAVGACGGSPSAPAPSPPPTVQMPAGASALITSMFQQLPAYLTGALADMRNLLPRNPQAASQINAKIALLQRQTLAAEIAEGRRFVEGITASIDGRTIQIAAMFPDESMRADARQAVRRVEAGVPVLEQFMDTPFPSSTIRIWYGFVVGNSGGNGVLDLEDYSSYQSRSPSQPYEAVTDHELAHSYIGNESLTQFLEMYTYNRLQGSSADLGSWSMTRGYGGVSDANEGSALVLDVYQLIGFEGMSGGFKSTYALRPPYGQPLSPTVVQAFVNQAPEAAKSQVAAKLSRITF